MENHPNNRYSPILQFYVHTGSPKDSYVVEVHFSGPKRIYTLLQEKALKSAQNVVNSVGASEVSTLSFPEEEENRSEGRPRFMNDRSKIFQPMMNKMTNSLT